MIIDIHAHAYPERIAKKVKERMESVSGSQVENLGTPEALVEEMEKNGVDHSVFLPVATNPGQVGKLNAQANRWMEALNQHGISYVAWNLSNKNETSAILSSSCGKTSGFTEEDLSASGRWLRAMLTGQ